MQGSVMPKVNVIITCYNKEKTIARAIETVKWQTLDGFFCIVVDDGSTDNSWESINDAIENDDVPDEMKSDEMKSDEMKSEDSHHDDINAFKKKTLVDVARIEKEWVLI